MKRTAFWKCLWWVALLAPVSMGAVAQAGKAMDADKAQVIAHWTGERRAGAIPRDLVIDPRGLGYLKGKGGRLEPYGHGIVAQMSSGEPAPVPRAKPVGGDQTPPTITEMSPGQGAVINSAYTFSAKVTDASGVKSVTFSLQKSGQVAQTFSAAKAVDGVTWSASLSGFSDGAWSWWVVAKDAAGKGGNTATSAQVAFTVNTGGGGADVVGNAPWDSAGVVQYAAGRLYFEMPSNIRRTRWVGYVCSATVAADDVTGHSTLVTAAHCVYDDANKAFARNVMFIPNQDATTGAGTDLDCSNDPIGCWVPSFGVVDINWTTRTFPDNIPWDYAFYVVADAGAHQGAAAGDVLDVAVIPMSISFGAVSHDVSGSADYTHALGYSYSQDPNFMYCAEDMSTEGADNWWLASCGLTGGSSGGPWVQPMLPATGDGPVISVNSWGYTSQPGMAGPKLVGTSAHCVFEGARTSVLTTPTADGDAGVAVTCP